MEIDTESLETGEEAPGAGAADAEVDDVSVQRGSGGARRERFAWRRSAAAGRDEHRIGQTGESRSLRQRTTREHFVFWMKTA